jgi:2-desacetyl-2-hydroxyethyl bacteriochlorophyllide A dehydrogenase
MRAVQVTEPGEWSVADVPDPSPGKGELVLRVEVCGLCGTDMHVLDGELTSAGYPLVPGHELAGEVVQVGHGVEGAAVGDRMAVDPNLPCGRCHYCHIGRGNLCENYSAIGVTRAGGFAQLVLVPETAAYRLPEDIPTELAGLVEPLSCAVHGLNRLPRTPGAHYLVYGAGTMGLLMAYLVRSAGAASVSIVDTNDDRLSFATDFGVDSATAHADELDRPEGFEVVIDATGALAAINEGLTRVRRGGTFLQFGVAAEDARASFSPFAVYNREIDIIGSMAVHHSFGRAIDLLAAAGGGTRKQLSSMVSDVLPIDRFDDAVSVFRSGSARKVQIAPS